VLSLALAYAVLDGRLSRNPAEGVPLPRAKGRAKRFLTHVEVERLAAECGLYSTLIYVLAYRGLRWGEVAALQVADLDLMRRRIQVNRAMAEVRGPRGRRDAKGPPAPRGADPGVPRGRARCARGGTGSG
jgi:integrase